MPQMAASVVDCARHDEPYRRPVPAALGGRARRRRSGCRLIPWLRSGEREMTRRDEPGDKDSAQLIEGLTATLRAAKIRRAEIERKLHWSAGYVSRLLKGTIEMRLSHLFAIL